MSRIIALLMSIIMTIFSAFGIAFPTTNPVTEEEWIVIVVDAFGIVGDDYLSAAINFGVLDGLDYDAAAYATNRFINTTLENVASVDLEQLLPNNNWRADYDKALIILQIAVELCNNQPISEEPEIEVDTQNGVADLTNLEYSVVGDKLVYPESKFKLKVGAKFIAGANEYNVSGAAYIVKGVDYVDGCAIVTVETLPIEETVAAIDFEGSVDVDLNQANVTDGKGNVIESEPEIAAQGFIKDKAGELIDKGKAAAADFLKNPQVSFKIKGFKIKAAYSGGRVDLSIGGGVADGVTVEKYYSLTNITADAKYNANLATLDIKEAYLKLNYDLVETTVLQGSYAASVVPDGGAFTTEGDTFLEKVKNNLQNLEFVKGGGIEVNVVTFDIPIGSTGLTVELNICLTISATGRIEIIVTSNETKGYEVINNRGRVIHESNIIDREYNISGDFQVTLGLNLSLTFLRQKIIDVGLNGGVGAYVLTSVFNVKTNKRTVSEVPLDVTVEAASGLDNLEDLRFCADVQLYGILRVSVGQKSLIGKIGLKKTWTIYDRSNAVFAELHIENKGIVDHCSYVA